ncbi:30S ribosome-binding factor RbfA [Mycoplasma todarodis]|uniref:Ribosome-binding factor A n=1 Tax=Mycoplasma todarodis TaxID=1937191 RepID=A0A4R0XIN8_9MOLU|nr:30S ribosome-binding factor RbfA [Mycoplasma todarodis]TCG10443.1 30S ribosome-binding factor RbfA [Mycoplasma todarodis]
MSVTHQKKEKMFLRAVSQIISEEITNVNVSYTTVTDVKLSRDGSHLNVYLTFESNKERSMENLQKARGFIRTQLSKTIHMRKTPEVHLKHDESMAIGSRIDEILNSIKKNEK